MKATWIVALALVASLPVSAHGSRPRSLGISLDHSMVVRGVSLRPGVKADVHVRVFVNEATPLCLIAGETAFAVHGVAHAAASWEPAADELFDQQPGRAYFCRVYAIDLPGQGQSPLPQGILFGDLTQADHVAAIRGTIAKLRSVLIRPKTIVGHSQGGLLVQVLQQQLLDEGTNLRQALGFKNAVLLASSIPAPLDWAFAASPAAAETVGAFVTATPERGAHADIPDAVWPSLFFTNFSGVLHPSTPGAAEVAAYNAPEPLLSALQLLGLPPFSRTEIDAGAFAPSRGTRLYVVGYTQDPFGLPAEEQALYVHLTGDASLARFAIVEDDVAVHDLHVADPTPVLGVIDDLVD